MVYPLQFHAEVELDSEQATDICFHSVARAGEAAETLSVITILRKRQDHYISHYKMR